jgi:hypothetical protein
MYGAMELRTCLGGAQAGSTLHAWNSSTKRLQWYGDCVGHSQFSRLGFSTWLKYVIAHRFGCPKFAPHEAKFRARCRKFGAFLGMHHKLVFFGNSFLLLATYALSTKKYIFRKK